MDFTISKLVGRKRLFLGSLVWLPLMCMVLSRVDALDGHGLHIQGRGRVTTRECVCSQSIPSANDQLRYTVTITLYFSDGLG